MTYPKLSILIVALNAERTIGDCLKYIRQQTYPHIDEILLVDGGSTDNTLQITRNAKMKITIVKGGYKENQEARRAVGIMKTKNEYIAMIDTDNYLLDPNWLIDMVEPLMKHKDVIASQSLRYAAPKGEPLLNRYFGLLGAADPVAYYLGKADRLNWVYDKWNLLGTVKKEYKKYWIVAFKPRSFPTVGANGIIFKKSLLLESNWGKPENYFHTDVFVDIAKKYGRCRFAIVKNETYHNTADTLATFAAKRTRYMTLHHQHLQSARRYSVFDPKNPSDIIKLGLFVIYALTFVEPLWQAIYGFRKKRDIAWFLHPYVCFVIMLSYTKALVHNYFVSR
ncbi:glycosyltransferase family 2 protein [Candidatus Woesebacteria bacterium]|nr:glycosyltransferase family 2 protein [Candidatus Woesebacteria bacterium]